jgi:hypothetical protein
MADSKWGLASPPTPTVPYRLPSPGRHGVFSGVPGCPRSRSSARPSGFLVPRHRCLRVRFPCGFLVPEHCCPGIRSPEVPYPIRHRCPSASGSPGFLLRSALLPSGFGPLGFLLREHRCARVRFPFGFLVSKHRCSVIRFPRVPSRHRCPSGSRAGRLRGIAASPGSLAGRRGPKALPAAVCVSLARRLPVSPGWRESGSGIGRSLCLTLLPSSPCLPLRSFLRLFRLRPVRRFGSRLELSSVRSLGSSSRAAPGHTGKLTGFPIRA